MAFCSYLYGLWNKTFNSQESLESLILPNERTIENEVRGLISRNKYQDFLKLFSREGELVKVDEQLTYYFKGDQELRIQQNLSHAFVQVKIGGINSEQKQKITVRYAHEQFPELKLLFLNLGYEINSVWKRKRHEFRWGGVKVTLNDTLGYGCLIDMEVMSQEQNPEIVNELKNKFCSLGIEPTTQEVMDDKFEWFQRHWKTFIPENTNVPTKEKPINEPLNVVEIETKSLLSKRDYLRLLDFFTQNTPFVREQQQFTHLFEMDNKYLRVVRTDDSMNLCLKIGDMHDEIHKEINLHTAPEFFTEMMYLIQTLGYEVNTKWSRRRHTFKWNDIKVQLGDTKVYGPVLELEKLILEGFEEDAIQTLRKKLDELSVKQSTKEELDTRYEWYRKHWAKFVTE
ncbi:MAG: hypothetical protein ABIF40_04890 [archaeon]